MIAFGPIVILLLCLLAAWMGVMAVIRVCFVPKGVEPGGSCGSCNYPYSGWQRCPECGGDVGEEGIATPRLMLKHRGSLRAALFSLTMLAAALIFLLTGLTLGICQAAGWMLWTRQSEYQLTQSTPSPAGILVHWEMLGRSGASNARGEILVVVNPNSPFAGTSGTPPATTGVAHARINGATGAFELIDASGKAHRTGELFGPDDGAYLLQAAGVSVSGTELDDAGRHLAALASTDNAMAAAVFSPPVTFTGEYALTEGATSTYSIPSLPFAVFGATNSSAAMILAGIVSGALYVFALWVVLKRRRRLMQRVQRPTELSSLAGV